VHRMAGEHFDRDAERGDLCQGEIDEDHAARQHVQAEVRVDAGQHQAGEQRPEQELDHGQPGPREASRRLTFSSNIPM
jgi:hypothetical protein